MKKSKLNQSFIFSSSCLYLQCSKRDHDFTSKPTRGLAEFLTPRSIHLASCPYVPEIPRKHNSDAWVSYLYSSKSSQTLLTLPNFSSSQYLKFSIPFQNSRKYLQEKNPHFPTSSLLFITQNSSSYSLSIIIQAQ